MRYSVIGLFFVFGCSGQLGSGATQQHLAGADPCNVNPDVVSCKNAWMDKCEWDGKLALCVTRPVPPPEPCSLHSDVESCKSDVANRCAWDTVKSLCHATPPLPDGCAIATDPTSCAAIGCEWIVEKKLCAKPVPPPPIVCGQILDEGKCKLAGCTWRLDLDVPCVETDYCGTITDEMTCVAKACKWDGSLKVCSR